MLFDAVGGCDQQNSMEALSLADLEAGWSPRPSMEVRRHLPGVGVLDGLIYVVGGADSQWSAQRTVECFHPGMCTLLTYLCIRNRTMDLLAQCGFQQCGPYFNADSHFYHGVTIWQFLLCIDCYI